MGNSRGRRFIQTLPFQACLPRFLDQSLQFLGGQAQLLGRAVHNKRVNSIGTVRLNRGGCRAGAKPMCD